MHLALREGDHFKATSEAEPTLPHRLKAVRSKQTRKVARTRLGEALRPTNFVPAI